MCEICLENEIGPPGLTSLIFFYLQGIGEKGEGGIGGLNFVGSFMDSYVRYALESKIGPPG